MKISFNLFFYFSEPRLPRSRGGIEPQHTTTKWYHWVNWPCKVAKCIDVLVVKRLLLIPLPALSVIRCGWQTALTALSVPIFSDTLCRVDPPLGTAHTNTVQTICSNNKSNQNTSWFPFSWHFLAHVWIQIPLFGIPTHSWAFYEWKSWRDDDRSSLYSSL